MDRLKDVDKKDDIAQLKMKIGLVGDFSRVDTSQHHIFPGNKINRIIQECLSKKIGQGEQREYKADHEIVEVGSIISSFLHNKGNLAYAIKDQIGRQDYANAGDMLYNSIFWFKNNLVTGPKKRSDDPKSQLDKPLLQMQTPNYQEKIESVLTFYQMKEWNKALSSFLRLPINNNVVWKRLDSEFIDPKESIYKVDGKSKLPGTVGFIY